MTCARWTRQSIVARPKIATQGGPTILAKLPPSQATFTACSVYLGPGGAMPQDTRPDIREIRTVGIPVTDQDAALRFYADTLGFGVRTDAPGPQGGRRRIEVAPPGAVVTVPPVAAPEDPPAGVETGIRLRTPDAA